MSAIETCDHGTPIGSYCGLCSQLVTGIPRARFVIRTERTPEPKCRRCDGIGRVEEFGVGWNVIGVMACPVCAGAGVCPLPVAGPVLPLAAAS
jgi:hypothetical protein